MLILGRNLICFLFQGEICLYAFPFSYLRSIFVKLMSSSQCTEAAVSIFIRKIYFAKIAVDNDQLQLSALKDKIKLKPKLRSGVCIL